MSAPSPDLAWDAVGERLEAFAAAWEGDREPSLRDHLPDDSPPLRRLALVELVKLDIECRLAKGIARPVEDYFAEFPELPASGLPVDLLYEDFHLRHQAGEAVSLDDYCRRFPSAASALGRMIDHPGSTRSTAVGVSAARLAIAAGESLDDFDLLTLLGEGQFAKVFLARQRSMQRLVALKVSAARGAEAQTLAQLDHPHIVRVYDQRLSTEDGLQLVYMSYVAGGTLLQLLERSRQSTDRSGRTLLSAVDAALDARGERPPAVSPARTEWAGRGWPATVCAIGAKLAAALDYAHRKGVLHRDLKPANVLLDAEGEPLLADFNVGCCSKLDGAGPAAVFGGSIAYMAPEHLEAFNPEHARSPDSLDGRADVFSLAMTLWELLSGSRLFGGALKGSTWPAMLEELVANRKAGPPQAVIDAVRDDETPGLRSVLLDALEADPDRRPATAGEFARELELCLRPPTRALVRPPRHGWRSVVQRHSLATLLVAGLVPNVLGSLFNIAYNGREIIGHWPAAEAVFEHLIMAVNAVFFPVGIALVIVKVLPMSRTLRRRESPEARATARQRALRLGTITALVCASCWGIAGLIWPIALRIVAGPPPQGPEAYVHFLLSLLVCGLIAAAYPYFIITALAVRVWFPALVGKQGLQDADLAALDRIDRQLGFYRSAAAAVPLLAVAILASRGASNPAAVAVLGVAGLMGTLVAYLLEGRIRADINALRQVPREAAPWVGN